MTNPKTEPDKAMFKRGKEEPDRSKASSDSSLPRTQSERAGRQDVASLEATKEALRNTGRGDQFVVATDLEDSEQREAAPGTREQD